MAVVNGNDIGVYVGGVLIGCLTNASFSSQNEEIVVTCKDNAGAKAVLSGGNSASISFDGMFNPSSTYNFGDLVALHLAGTSANIRMGDNTNLTIYATAFLQTLEWTGPLNAGSTFSGTFNITGVWTFYET